MIAKKFRLQEKEVKKVLHRWKPFFAYGVVLNKTFNKQWYNRFAIVVWWKSVNTNVTRVFFRRKFYDIIKSSKLFSPLLNKEGIKGWSFVFVVKKQTKLDRKDKMAIKSFEKDLNFLIKKVS